jgi:signal transduction histidine kinase/ActR/RegA family two-component response regulator
MVVAHPDGTKINLEVFGSPIRDNEGNIWASLVTFQDITARKQAEADKAELQAQNRQLQKTDSLSRMAAAIAHHFNNQLGVVIGNLEMAIDEHPKGAPPDKSLTAAMQAAWKSADMSRLMLTYLGQSRDKVEPLDISYCCRKILPILKAAMPGNVILETDFSSPGPVINSNIDYMQQILTNLITNAWEAIGKNTGTITLSVKTVSPAEIPTAQRHPINWQLQDSAYACLEVTDTGCGVDDKHIEQLFDPFFTDKFTGRGMGLAVVLGLAKVHDGVVTVESKPGRGSTFNVFFPLSEEALMQPQTAENDSDIAISSPSPEKFEEGGTVLLIEDEEPLRKMVAIMLKRLGFTVLEAKDGIEALEVFGKHQSEIKFVLSDLTMPRMNGWEALTELRKLQPDIPVILASGYDKAHVMAGDHPQLPQAFLAKPYNLKALSNAISQAIEKKAEEL